jgi:hypothetical protein
MPPADEEERDQQSAEATSRPVPPHCPPPSVVVVIIQQAGGLFKGPARKGERDGGSRPDAPEEADGSNGTSAGPKPPTSPEPRRLCQAIRRVCACRWPGARQRSGQVLHPVERPIPTRTAARGRSAVRPLLVSAIILTTFPTASLFRSSDGPSPTDPIATSADRDDCGVFLVRVPASVL